MSFYQYDCLDKTQRAITRKGVSLWIRPIGKSAGRKERKRERERERTHSEAKGWKLATRDWYWIRRTRVSGHNTALRFLNKAPSVYTRSVANTLQLSYKRVGRGGEKSDRLYSGYIIRGGVHERNRGDFLAIVGRGERRGRGGEESKELWGEESRSACIDLSSSAPRPFSNFRSVGILCKPISILTAYLARWKEGWVRRMTIEVCDRFDELDRLDRRQICL